MDDDDVYDGGDDGHDIMAKTKYKVICA